MATIISITEATLLKGKVEIKRDQSSTAQRQFYVRFDSPPSDLDEVVLAVGLPVIGEAFKSGDPRICSNKYPASLGTQTDFLVTVEYEVPKLDAYNQNPLLRPDEISGDFASQNKPYFSDSSDTPKPVTSSAGEPFDKLPERSVGELGVTITGNRASLNLALWAGYFFPTHSINSGAVSVRGINFGTGILKLKGMRFAKKTENTYTFWQVEWQGSVAPDWTDTIDDRGFYYLKSGNLMPIYGADGKTRVAKPYPLDGSGGKKPNSTDTPAQLSFQPYPKKDFSVFGWTA